MLLSKQRICCCVQHRDSSGSNICHSTDLPLNKAVGIGWLLPQASGDKERDVLSACSQTLHGLWEAASGRGLYGHCVAVWSSPSVALCGSTCHLQISKCKLSLSSQSCAFGLGSVYVVDQVFVLHACRSECSLGLKVSLCMGTQCMPTWHTTRLQR